MDCAKLENMSHSYNRSLRARSAIIFESAKDIFDEQDAIIERLRSLHRELGTRSEPPPVEPGGSEVTAGSRLAQVISVSCQERAAGHSGYGGHGHSAVSARPVY